MSERRYDPVSGEWRVFGPPPAPAEGCPYCAGPFEVAVLETGQAGGGPSVAGSELYPVSATVGRREVVVYSDDHDLPLGRMGARRIARVFEVWADRYAELGRQDDVAYVSFVDDQSWQGHAHATIDASPDIPPRARRELDVATTHIEDYGTCVYCDVVARERSDGLRVVAQSRSFLAFVPFAARRAYEVHVTSLRHAASLLDLTDPERLALAEVVQAVLDGYDRRFGSPLRYVMSVHQAPTDDGEHQHISHFHIEFTPGPGVGAEGVVPEDAATRLRAPPGGTGAHP